MERKIRKLKRFSEGTLDPDVAQEYRRKLRQAQHELKVFVEEHNDVLHRDYSREKYYGEAVDKSSESGIIKEKSTGTAVTDVHNVGKIDIEIYKCITEDIQTDEVIITDRQIEHIKERHPNDYERFSQYFEEIVKYPDFIIEANKPSTALILKEIEINNEKFKTILRLATSEDDPKYKNSIITFMKIDEKEWNRIINNKKVLYKSE